MHCVCICVFGGVGGGGLDTWSFWLDTCYGIQAGFSLGQSCLSLRVLGITGTSCHCWLQLRIIPLLKKTDKSLKAPDYFSKFYLIVPQENRENLRTNQTNKQIKVLWKSIIVLKCIRHGTWLGARQMTYLIKITELALPELNNHLYLLKTK